MRRVKSSTFAETEIAAEAEDIATNDNHSVLTHLNPPHLRLQPLPRSISTQKNTNATSAAGASVAARDRRSESRSSVSSTPTPTLMPSPALLSFDDRPRDLLVAYRKVLRDLHRLNREMSDLRKEVRGYAEESSQWTFKYSRRIVSLSNICLAVYIIVKRTVQVVNNNSRSVLLLMINPMTWVKKPVFMDWLLNRLSNKSTIGGASGVISGVNNNSGGAAAATATASLSGNSVPMNSSHSHRIGLLPAQRLRDRTRQSLASLLRDRSSLFRSPWSRALYHRYYGNGRDSYGRERMGQQRQHHVHHHHHPHQSKLNGGDLQFMLLRLMWKAVVRAALLLFSSYYLGKREIWKRNLGLLVSISSNVHMAFTGEISAWAIYFNMFITLLYITARYYKQIPAAIDTVSEHTRRGLSRTMSMQNLARFSPISSGSGNDDHEDMNPSQKKRSQSRGQN